MVREHLGALINRQKDMRVCGEAEDRSDGLELISQKRPLLALVDLSLKSSSGLDLIKDLRAILPDLKILVISMHDENLYAERSIRSGAHGYVSKQEKSEEILEAIRRVLSGKIYMSPALSEKTVSRMLGKLQGSDGAVDELTDREFQIFDLIGQGYRTVEIARHLRLEVKTIDSYRTRIKAKLKLSSTSELLRKAITWRQDAGAR